MSVQSLFRNGLAMIQAAAPNAVVTVKYKGATATALRSGSEDDAGMGDMIESGVERGRVRIDASLISRPARGDTILIDGETAFVTAIQEDAAGALWNISYQDQRPVEGI